MTSNPKILAVVGPTASGKSDLAVKLAKKYNGEVISADSRQVYKGLDIGAGKITKKEMRGVRHHLLDVALPKRVYTVVDFKRDAEKAIRDILKRGKLPIIVGGTGLYIDTLLYNSPLPEVKPNLKLRAELGKKSAAELFAMLQEKDPERAQNIDSRNPRRLIRALEIVEAMGKVPRLSERKEKYDVMKIGVSRPPEELKKRIHARLMSRMRQGMVREVEHLHKSGIPWKRLDDLGLEYRFISRYLRGLLTKEEVLKQLENAIWHYARRQMTWWRKDREIHWVISKDQFPIPKNILSYKAGNSGL